MRWQTSGRVPHGMRWLHLAAGTVLVVVAGGTSAGGPVYDTSRFAASTHNECRGVPSCLSVDQALVKVPGWGRMSARFACPATHPYVWGWDVAQHEHVWVELTDVDRDSVTVRGNSRADAAGSFVVSLGCSPQVYAGSSFFSGRSLVPTGTFKKGL